LTSGECAEDRIVRAVTFLALAVGVALLAGSVGLGMRDRSEKRRAIDQALQGKVRDEAGQLEGTSSAPAPST